MLFLSITACEDSITLPQIGQSQSSLDEMWGAQKVGKIDKDSFPNIWILKKYHMMVEFDEADIVKHFAICRKDQTGPIAFGYDVFAKNGNIRVVYRRDSQYLYVTGLTPAWYLGISEEEAQTLEMSFATGSDEFNKPDSIIKNKELLEKIRFRWWEYVLDIL